MRNYNRLIGLEWYFLYFLLYLLQSVWNRIGYFLSLNKHQNSLWTRYNVRTGLSDVRMFTVMINLMILNLLFNRNKS